MISPTMTAWVFDWIVKNSFCYSGRFSPYSDDGFLDPPSGPPPRPQALNKPPIPASAPNRESPDPFNSQAKTSGQEVHRISVSENDQLL